MNSSAVYADIAALIADAKPMALWVDTAGRLHKASASEPFIIVEAWAKYADRHMIGGAGAATPLSSGVQPMPYEVEHHSTLRSDYIPAVNAVIDGLKERGGKSVISRTTCGSAIGIDWAAVAMRYFERYPATMRYLYFTPLTGYWLGASPELLYRGDGHSHIDTMALAGTRQRCIGDWDMKNVHEHRFVVDYITSVLSDAGLNVTVNDMQTLDYGIIQHLLTRISAAGHYAGHAAILDKLSPTPALAGYPLDAARRDIHSAERHSRRCYSGYVAVGGADGSLEAYVNLRCVNFDRHRWCIYTGGGITAESTAEDEWRESEVKAAVLADIITSTRL
ncbi:MAG: chorismate-binding protein [Muribaculaceae bacterium]